jgi:hypothetical protein
MRRVLLLATLLSVSTALAAGVPPPGVPFGGPAPRAYNFPPVTRGEHRVVWLGPYTSSDWVQVGQRSQVTVRWYSPDGKVTREIVQPGGQQMFGDYVEKSKVLYAVNGPWHFTPMDRKRVNGVIDTSPDAYLLSYSPKEGVVRADLYWHGELAASVGPFYQYRGNDSLTLGPDGSLSIVAWSGPDRRTPQAIAIARNGEVRVRAAVDQSASSSIPAPGAEGVLVTFDSREAPYTFMGRDGTRTILPVPGYNFGFYSWIPGTTKALTGTSIGFDAEYQLIECRTGAVLWRLALPKQPPEVGPLGVAGPYLIFGGLEFNDTLGGPPGSVRTLYAVDIATGQIIAHWLPASSYAHDWGDYALRLLARDGTYYLISDREFSALNLEDIKAKRNGWQ